VLHDLGKGQFEQGVWPRARQDFFVKRMPEGFLSFLEARRCQARPLFRSDRARAEAVPDGMAVEGSCRIDCKLLEAGWSFCEGKDG
jgi:hypothetical protein